MGYYSMNAVYQRLKELPNSPFVWVSGNAWILIYGDDNAKAKVIVFVVGGSIRSGNLDEIERARKARGLARALAVGANLPFFTIQYDDEVDEIDSVIVDGSQVSLEELKGRFESTGLPVRSGSTEKAINSQGSSAYHQWQRQNLGAITVSDVDLVRLDSSLSSPMEIVELKRSFRSLSDWRPYPQDFPNFNLIVDVASRTGAAFTIAYNYHVKQPHYVDDASRMSLFVYPAGHDGARRLGEFTFQQFIDGDY